MATLNPVIIERLGAIARAAAMAGHGNKEPIYKAGAAELGISRATLLRHLKSVTLAAPRKRRSDAGQTVLTLDEARLICGVLVYSARKNDKRLFGVADAVEALRADGKILAARVIEETGEVVPLSESTIARALRGYGLHPDQVLAPAPVTELQSLHPNHVWQIDASLCVLYYLKPTAKAEACGLQVMDSAKFYKNKPRNLARISADRVWSYEITDHASGWVYVEYVMGAESGENLCSVLINALQERGGADMLHGVPRILMMDPGSANTSSMARNLCRSLGIQMIVHAPGAARVTGQVENARQLLETKFESRLRFRAVNSLEELNQLAAIWRAHFNATAVHGRHSKTRTAVWMLITAAQLIKAPSVERCRELAVSTPVERKVSPKLRVSFDGSEYDVSRVPGVMVGEKVLITVNPWREDAAQVLQTGEDGRDVFYVVPRIELDSFGFAINAPATAIIGAEHSRHAATPAEKARQAVDQVMTGADSATGIEAAKKAKAVPLGGTFNPFTAIDPADLPTYLPRRGTEHSLRAPDIDIPPLSRVQVAMRLQARLGALWTAQSMAWLSNNYPDGAPEEQLDAILAALQQALDAPARPVLRVVGGE
jgi:transposase InsO family protein